LVASAGRVERAADDLAGLQLARARRTTRRSPPKAAEPSTGPGANHLNLVSSEASGYDSWRCLFARPRPRENHPVEATRGKHPGRRCRGQNVGSCGRQRFNHRKSLSSRTGTGDASLV